MKNKILDKQDCLNYLIDVKGYSEDDFNDYNLIELKDFMINELNIKYENIINFNN